MLTVTLGGGEGGKGDFGTQGNKPCLFVQLLMQCMNSALGQEGVEVQAHRLSQVLVRVHRLMVTVRPRLQAVLDMAACHPQAIQALQDKRHDPQVFDQDNELVTKALN